MESNISEAQKWHWGEGTKYVVEGGRALLLINGAAAVSILTFIGHTHNRKDFIATAMIIFSVGALFSSLIFLVAYLTQLQYGNNNQKWAVRWHIVTYCVVSAGILLFVAGIIVAGVGFLSQP